MDLMTELRERGLVYQVTDETLGEILAKEHVTLYAGFDPTGESLHVGNLLHLVTLARFQRAGHRAIAVAGGATGMIGDPGGRSSERNLLTPTEVAANLERHKEQMRKILDFESKTNPARIMNNAEWLGEFTFLEFLRDVGKHFSVPNMLAKDSVKDRLAGGISFTEFAYALLQAYDFYHLFENHGCKLQIGGQDQWGNITSGVDFIRRKTGKTAYGMTSELIKTASGAKFGKSEGNAVWLDATLTSPYQFYQFWVRTEDGDVIDYMKRFTFMPLRSGTSGEGIDYYEALLRGEARQGTQLNLAQARLAYEMTKMVHGASAADKARNTSEVLFGGTISGLSDSDIEGIFGDAPSSSFHFERLSAGLPLIEGLTETGMCKSRGEARRLFEAGGVYVNNVRVGDAEYKLTGKDLASEHFAVLRTGKKNYHLLRFE